MTEQWIRSSVSAMYLLLDIKSNLNLVEKGTQDGIMVRELV